MKTTDPDISADLLADLRQAMIATAAQGGRSVGPTGSCMYDDHKGGHCAVGHLAKAKGCLHMLLENKGINAQHSDTVAGLGATTSSEYLCLIQVQQAHDGASEQQSVAIYSRPFGMSWGEWFWYRACYYLRHAQVYPGPYPRREVQAYADA